MTGLRHWALRGGWLALAVLALVAWRQGIGPAPLTPGGWGGSLLALGVLVALLVPGRMARALPAAGLAVLVGGLLFTLVPEAPALAPEDLMKAGSLGAAALCALLCLGGGTRGQNALAGVIASALHLGLMQVLTPAGLTAPHALWPWALPALAAAWTTGALVAR